MLSSRIGQTMLTGHGLVGEGNKHHRTDKNEALCSCGEHSPAGLSQGAARRWHAAHKDMIRAGAAAIAAAADIVPGRPSPYRNIAKSAADAPARDHRFYFVQSATSSPTARPNKTGVDRWFAFDYMGSAEFEFGALNTALHLLRASGPLVIRPADIEIAGLNRVVYFVGPEPAIDQKIDDFDYWAHQASPFYAKENHRFAGAFNGTSNTYEKSDAWWSLRDAIAWTLDPDLAMKLLAGLSQ